MLRFESVSFAYRRAEIFSGLDLEIGAGQLVGVLGPNGSGKTTLVRLGCGHLEPRRGSVTLDAEDVRTIPARRRAQRVAVVPQETRLAFDFDVRSVVLMGRAPHLGLLGLDRPADRRLADEWMERCEVSHLADRSFHRLSGGERQRVVLARALVQQPELLLLDEPTAFLDLKHRLAVYDLLDRLNREHGVTVLAVGHDLNLVARFCRRLVLLRDGEIVADGAADEVLTADNVLRAYDVEAEVRHDPRTGRPYAVPLRPRPRGGGTLAGPPAGGEDP